MKIGLYTALGMSLLLLAGNTACDSVAIAALQSGEAGLRSIVDLLLTDFTNQVASNLEGETGADGDMDADGGDMDTDGDGDGDGGDTDGGMTDDPVASGEALVADQCAVCHGADGASGFAPNIQGADEATIADNVSGGGGHAVYDLSVEDIADVAAYLGSF